MKKISFTLSILVLLVAQSQAQEVAPFRQFFFNPYLLNPSYVGSNGYTEFGMVYRRQWLDIEDSPTIAGFNVQIPTYSRVSIGLNVVTQEVVALRNTSTLATFGYNVPIASQQFIRFGISGGFGFNNLNLSDGDFDPNDPTIANAMQNTYYLDGNFGISYTNKGLNLGFSFLSLFDSKYVNQSNETTKNFNQLKNRLFSASYKFPLSSQKFQFEPMLFYRESENEIDYFEGMAMVYFKNVIWLGASYNNVKGAAFMLGAGINQFRFGYSYELPPVDKTFINTSSHEFQLSLRIGNKRGPTYKKNPKIVTITPNSVIKKDSSEAAELIKKEEVEIKQEQKPIEAVGIPRNEKTAPIVTDSVIHEVIEPQKEADKEPVKEIKSPDGAEPPKTFTIGKGHYVVVGAFRIMQNAINYSLDLQRKGYHNATVTLNPTNRLYYVYIYSSYEIDEAKKIRNINRVKRLFQDAWILTIE